MQARELLTHYTQLDFGFTNLEADFECNGGSRLCTPLLCKALAKIVNEMSALAVHICACLGVPALAATVS